MGVQPGSQVHPHASELDSVTLPGKQGNPDSITWKLVALALALSSLLAVLVVILPRNDKFQVGNGSHVTKRLGWNNLYGTPEGNGNLPIFPQIRSVFINQTGSPRYESMASCIDRLQRRGYKYNFLVGRNGEIFADLGWDIWSHSTSIEILFLGNYTTEKVYFRQRHAVPDMLKLAKQWKVLDQNYWLQAKHDPYYPYRPGPGKNLLSAIKQWPNYHSWWHNSSAKKKNTSIDKNEKN